MICFSPPLTIFLTELLAPFVFPGYFVCISVIALTECCHYFFRYLFAQPDCGSSRSLKIEIVLYYLCTHTMPDIQ